MQVRDFFAVLASIGALLGIVLMFAGFIYAAYNDYKDIKNMNTPNPKAMVIKTVYFYLVSIISLFMVVFAAADLVNLGLTTWVFTKADRNPYPMMPCSAQIYKDPAAPQNEEMYRQQIAQCEENQKNDKEAQSIQKQKDAVRDISFLVVGIPLFLYHWTTIRRESKKDA